MRLSTDEDSLATVIGVLESGVEMVHKGYFYPIIPSQFTQRLVLASKTGDVKLRLEKFLASVVCCFCPMKWYT